MSANYLFHLFEGFSFVLTRHNLPLRDEDIQVSSAGAEMLAEG